MQYFAFWTLVWLLVFVCDQLLKTADSSTSDVSGLHAKLDRKCTIENHNESAQEKFRSRFCDSVDCLNSEVKALITQQERFSTSLCKSFGQSVFCTPFFY